MAKIPGTHPIAIDLVAHVEPSPTTSRIGTLEIDVPVRTTVYNHGRSTEIIMDAEGFREALAVALEDAAKAIRNEDEGWELD